MTRFYRTTIAAIAIMTMLPALPYAGETNTEKAKATDAVPFAVEIVSGGTRWGPPETTWRMTHTKDKKTATFKVTLPHKPSGKGAFLRDEKKTDAAVLLGDLAKALRGKIPEKVDPVDRLPVTFYILGDKMSRTKTGSFKAEPAGDWLLVKIFAPKDQGEFYLNINEKDGKGEIRMKEPDKGDLLVGELAKILAPSE
jgi:hypothetical protein